MVKINIDSKLLKELGITGLDDDSEQELIAQLYTTLQQRVGLKIASQLDEQQLAEFESLIDKSDNEGATKLLESSVPDYSELVAQEFEQLKADIKQDTATVLDQLKNAK